MEKFHAKYIKDNAEIRIYFNPEATTETKIMQSLNEYDTIVKERELLIDALKNDINLLDYLAKRYELSEWPAGPCKSNYDKAKELLNNLKP